MEHITKAATVTATTELGEFTAIAAAYTLDRNGDEIVHGAFAKTIEKWRASGKRIPLHWNHSGAASDIIGSIDPATLREKPGVGLKASGRLDLDDSDTAREAWRAMKSGSMSLSFGYLVVRGVKRKDGVNELHDLDLFEISIVPAPANPDTRILSMKSAEDLREEAKRVEREVEQIQIPAVPEPPKAPVEPEIDYAQELQEVKAQLAEMRAGLEDLRKQAEVTGKETKSRSVDPLRQQAETLALDIASGGLDRLPEKQAPAPEPAPDLVDLAELKQRSRDLMLQVLSGVDQ